MEKKYVVPEEGLKAAKTAGEEYLRDNQSRDVYLHECLEAFIRWQSENPPEITDEMKRAAAKYSDGHPWPECRYAFTVAYLSPETKAQEAVRDLVNKSYQGLCDMTIGKAVSEWYNRIQKVAEEAYHRGKESK